jgi:hypothetical protein
MPSIGHPASWAQLSSQLRYCKARRQSRVLTASLPLSSRPRDDDIFVAYPAYLDLRWAGVAQMRSERHPCGEHSTRTHAHGCRGRRSLVLAGTDRVASFTIRVRGLFRDMSPVRPMLARRPSPERLTPAGPVPERTRLPQLPSSSSSTGYPRTTGTTGASLQVHEPTRWMNSTKLAGLTADASAGHFPHPAPPSVQGLPFRTRCLTAPVQNLKSVQTTCSRRRKSRFTRRRGRCGSPIVLGHRSSHSAACQIQHSTPDPNFSSPDTCHYFVVRRCCIVPPRL